MGSFQREMPSLLDPLAVTRRASRLLLGGARLTAAGASHGASLLVELAHGALTAAALARVEETDAERPAFAEVERPTLVTESADPERRPPQRGPRNG